MMTTHRQLGDASDASDGADGASVGEAEDLATLLTRALAEVDRSQKDLAAASNITYTRLNHWLRGTRGTSRIAPDDLRALTAALRHWGADVSVAEVFQAAGRAVPGRAGDEREARLLRIYRALPVSGQRALLQHAELLEGAARRK
ncbi:transcriptional regulator [Streptomyces sp. NPDC006798]|uniref:transcriptional regulator n=1 Tax=Streptomyces sp. NPDC006798 TaxID=3155462 RepID=UPI0033ECC8F1